MKRVITFILVIFSLLSTSITCFAAESEEVVECPVYAKYHSSNIELNTTIIDNGKGTLTNQDGSLFVLNFEDKYNGYVLVIHPITEKDTEAFSWFKSCVPNSVEEFSSYDIYLLNDRKERVELPDNTSIQISASSRDDFIMGLTYSGETFIITTTYKDSQLKFKSSERAHYYLRCRKSVNTNVDIDSPQTGDTSNIHLWIVLMFASLVMLIITSKKYLAYKE